MNPRTEIRHLPPSHLRELVHILEFMNSWKKLMVIIPKVLKKETFDCPLETNNLQKYNSDHIRKIEEASSKLKRDCSEILLTEWGCSGRVRPAIGHLLYLLKEAELFRAADYVACKILNQPPPERPKEGPAALITDLELPIHSPSSRSNETIKNNLDQSNSQIMEHVTPKKLADKLAKINLDEFKMCLIVDSPQMERNSSPHSRSNSIASNSSSSNSESSAEVSDMMKFSTLSYNTTYLNNLSYLESSICSANNISNGGNFSMSIAKNVLPAVTDLLQDSAKEKLTESASKNSINIPALVNLVATNDTITSPFPSSQKLDNPQNLLVTNPKIFSSKTSNNLSNLPFNNLVSALKDVSLNTSR